MTSKNLLVELFVEELPPKALKKLGEAFGALLVAGLDRRNYFVEGGTAEYQTFATPRRLAVLVQSVFDQSRPIQLKEKLMSASAAFSPEGNPSLPLVKKIKTMFHDNVDVDEIVRERCQREGVGKAEVLFLMSSDPGQPLARGLFESLKEAIENLPIPKVMSYQLESGCDLPGWSSVNFVRPVHGLVALHGSEVVPVQALGLQAGRSTQGHRFEAEVSPVVINSADDYVKILRDDGKVIAEFDERLNNIRGQLATAAGILSAELGSSVTPINDPELLQEVTALVERPNVLVCEFEKQFLDVPQECLILTMKANQKYFPLLDAAGKLTNQFLVVSNISPADASAVVQGNERVVRPRLADAKFFFDQDRKKTLASRVEGLSKVVYHNKLGTQGERMERVRAIARAIGQQLGGASLAEAADTAARLAKTDLVTDMVGEFPELQGIMGAYYARHDGLPNEIADAIEDHYKPRFAGDSLPRNQVGVVVALADKLETLVGMFGIGNLPTGDKDPFALRRHALGVIRMLVERGLNLNLPQLVGTTSEAFGPLLGNAAVTNEQLLLFVYERIAGYLRDQGHQAQDVEAVLALRPAWGEIPKRLAAARSFAALPEAPALAAANKRISNILKKTEAVDPHVSEVLLKEPAEIALYAALKEIGPRANALFDAGDYTASLQSLAALRAPVDAFFEDVMVNAEQMDLRLNRLGLLTSLHAAMNRVADLSKLAT